VIAFKPCSICRSLNIRFNAIQSIDEILEFPKKRYPNLIQREFKGIFFLEEENAWLDKAVENLSGVKDDYKRSILMASLFQACLAKRPFNLFHRANLNIRTASVERIFGRGRV
jgi:adenine-specific DNA-methyltransferase